MPRRSHALARRSDRSSYIFSACTNWAAAGLLVATDDTGERCRALDLAADILANAYKPADRGVHLDAIAAKARDLGFGATYCDELKHNIRERFREQERNAGGEKPDVGGAGAATWPVCF